MVTFRRLLFTGNVAMALANLQTAEMLKAQRPAVEESKPCGPGFKLPSVPAMPPSQAPGPQAGSATAKFSPAEGTAPPGRAPFQPEIVGPQATRPPSDAPAGSAGDLHASTTN